MERTFKGKKYVGEKSREKMSFFSSCLDWGKHIRIWMRNLNVDKLLKWCWCHLNNVRLEKVRNFPQTFLTILRGKFYHLLIIIFPSNFPLYFFLWFSLNQTPKKGNFPKILSFHQNFQGSNGDLEFRTFLIVESRTLLT